MSKSTLRITVKTPYQTDQRTVEVPCRLPDSFTVHFKAEGGKFGATAYLSGWEVVDIETNDFVRSFAKSHIANALATIKAALGITGPVPPGSPLPAIALAYEAECAAHEACRKANAAMPRALHSPSNLNAHPSEREWTGPVVMLAKYVAHVVENAAKVTP